ncbi:hypothetical protein [Paludisphaera mucosa]|uniref:YtxH domain-containing protein n=1 Tax=Paludisphaera mucosa TaxID=3030827 RepID=A0ABT6FHQ5_9BACT|nr:hypothetical protein [Paludisphaera mucosa]MDG3007095.1 hypothetical protein [Paludisphaera mucosa]
MPFSRSNLLTFGAGLVAGAAGYATYPKWKHKVAPLVSAVVAGASAAFQDAQAAAAEVAPDADANAHAAHEATRGPWGATDRNGSGVTTPSTL